MQKLFNSKISPTSLITPFQQFTALEASAGIVMFIAAITALNYRNDILLNVKKLLDQRIRLEKFVEQYRPKINYYPSHGNFLLCHFENMFGSDVYKKLVSEGIFVRTFSDPLLSKCVRISSGTPEQTDRLLGALKNIVIS